MVNQLGADAGTAEARIRRMARRQGYALRKSRSRSIHADDLGDYVLIDVAGNYCVLGGKFDATLEHVEEFLRA